jgi:hypothetical protein
MKLYIRLSLILTILLALPGCKKEPEPLTATYAVVPQFPEMNDIPYQLYFKRIDGYWYLAQIIYNTIPESQS